PPAMNTPPPGAVAHAQASFQLAGQHRPLHPHGPPAVPMAAPPPPPPLPPAPPPPALPPPPPAAVQLAPLHDFGHVREEQTMDPAIGGGDLPFQQHEEGPDETRDISAFDMQRLVAGGLPFGDSPPSSSARVPPPSSARVPPPPSS